MIKSVFSLTTLHIWGTFLTNNPLPTVNMHFIWATLMWNRIPSLDIIFMWERKTDWHLLVLILFYFSLYEHLPLWHCVLLPILEKLLTSLGKKSGQQRMEQFLKEILGWINTLGLFTKFQHEINFLNKFSKTYNFNVWTQNHLQTETYLYCYIDCFSM